MASLVTLVALIALAAAGASCAQAAITHPYTTSFGPGGVGVGSFGQVVGVAVDQSSGDVFVLDSSEGGRVYKFDAAGEPVDFSSSGTNVIEGVGSAGASEEEIAVDSSTGPDAGDLYVANNSVVKIYSATGAPLGELSGGEMCGVAVDLSGNVYVGIYPGTVRRYAPHTSPVTNADEDGSMGGLSGICNIAVDAAGDVYAATYFGGINKYDALQFGSLAANGEQVDPNGKTLAVDPTDGEVFIAEGTHVEQFEGSAAPPARVGTTAVVGAASFGVGVDHESGKLYVGVGEVVQIFGPGVIVPVTEAASGVSTTEATLHGTIEPAGAEVTACVFEYGPAGGIEQRSLAQSTPCSPAAPYTGSAPVAVSAQLSGLELGTTYYYRIATTYASGNVVGEERSFATAGPQVSAERVPHSTLGSNDAELEADVNPGGEATTYRVEYGNTSAYGSSTSPVELEAGETADVSVHLDGLRANTTYHFRFVAVNATATAVGPDVTFTTPLIVKDQSFSEVGTTSALLNAVIDPGGEATTYLIEYGTSSSYGSATAPLSVGAGEQPVAVAAHLEELLPDTTYHFRFVTHKNRESEVGPDLALTTRTLASAGLPDGRGYEKVSPNANADGNVFQDMPEVTEAGATDLPFTISSDGSSIAYPADPSETGGVGYEGGDAGNEYVAHRTTSGGWSAVNEDPLASTKEDFPVYQGFSPDLSTGFLTAPGETPLVAGAPGEEYASLYSRTFADGAYQALLNVKPPHRTPDEFRSFGTPGTSPVGTPEPEYAGSSADFSHVLFMANDALTSNALDGGAEANNLYDSHDGALTLVNVLPDGSTEANASFGGPVPPPSPSSNDIPALDHDISADGSRIFWTDLNTHDLYVRENDTEPQSPISEGRCAVASDACTVLIAEEAQFWNATPDGATVLYTKGGELFEYELASGHSTDLAAGGEVQGIAGTSEDLSYVYFVADAALAPEATAQHCAEESAAEKFDEAPQTDGCNLYAMRVGESPRFVATLSLSDIQHKRWGYRATGDWVAGLGDKEAEATPDGRNLLFTSTRSLTGYDNRDGSEATEEIYLYDLTTTQLSCVSCDRTGEAPTSGSTAYLPPSHLYTSLPHWMSDDGDRVFFDTLQSLVPQDTNNATDVYEWERDGSGSCSQSPGCIYLISDGTSHEGSYLIGTTSSGDDVFFTTRATLVGEDGNENIDVYDARVGASAPPAPTQCTGTGCQGVPSAAPVFATPASSTYSGVGNLQAPATTSTKPKSKSKPLTRAQRLAKALKACRKKRQKKKRAACEKQARKSYGAHASTKRVVKKGDAR
jgi:hypothetical protein